DRAEDYHRGEADALAGQAEPRRGLPVHGLRRRPVKRVGGRHDQPGGDGGQLAAWDLGNARPPGKPPPRRPRPPREQGEAGAGQVRARRAGSSCRAGGAVTEGSAEAIFRYRPPATTRPITETVSRYARKASPLNATRSGRSDRVR